MNIQKAYNILDLTSNFSLKELKHNYHLKALKYHPDKNSEDNAKEKFIEVNEAYDFLLTYLEIQNENKHHSQSDYISLMKNFMHITGINIGNEPLDDIIKLFSEKSSKYSLIMLKKLNKETAVKLYHYFSKYKDVFSLDSTIIDEMKNILREKIKDDNFIILNPNINNLFNDDLYKLDFNNDIYYIPLWHSEISYDLSANENKNNSSLIIKCIPTLPEHISIDHFNNIHIQMKTSILDIFSKENLPISCGEKVFEIPISDLYIKTNQTYTFYKKGISSINTKEIYDVSRKSNIYVHLELVQ
jgi:hypothetical protein